MTRPSKKQYEKGLASRFLDGLEVFDYTSLDEDERPDFRVRRSRGDIALEITEYHSQAPEGGSDKTRVAVEALWWRYLEPFVNKERQTTSLKYVQASFRFGDHHISRNQYVAIARELVGAVQAVIKGPRFLGSEVSVEFASRAEIQKFQSFGHAQEGIVFLPREDWPEIARRLESLTVSPSLLEWPHWDCRNATAAWLGPDINEFKRILFDKADLAKDYALGGLPLWLLIVCDAVEDGGKSHGDLTSHVFPRNEAEKEYLAEVLRQTGFDFQAGPFTNVWLFSNFMRQHLRLHPPSD